MIAFQHARPLQRHGAISVGTIALLVVVLAILIAIQVLPGVGVRAAESGRTRVEVWSWNIAAESLNMLAPQFEAGRPDIDIDVKIGGTALQSRFLLALASRRGGPDISQLQERETGKYTVTGRLVDLTSWAAKYEKDFPPSFWASCVEDGKVFALPWDIAPCAVFYKRPIFEKYGVDPEKIETWADFIAAGKQIYEGSGGQTKLMPLASNYLKDPFQMFMQQAGGGIFDEAGRIAFDQPANLEALEVVRSLFDSGLMAAISDQAAIQASYNNDSVAAYAQAAWNLPMLKDASKSRAGQWGLMRLPAIKPGGIRTSNQGGSVVVIPDSSQHAAEASAFVEYTMCTVDAQLQQYEKWGLMPALLPALRDPRFDKPDPFFAGQRVSALFAQDFEKLPPVIRTKDWDEAEVIIGRELFFWHIERKDSKTWLRNTAKLLSDRLGRELAPTP